MTRRLTQIMTNVPPLVTKYIGYLKTFIACTECETLQQAATKLKIPMTQLRYNIASLHRVTQAYLIKIRHKKITITPAGKAAIPHIKQILASQAKLSEVLFDYRFTEFRNKHAGNKIVAVEETFESCRDQLLRDDNIFPFKEMFVSSELELEGTAEGRVKYRRVLGYIAEHPGKTAVVYRHQKFTVVARGDYDLSLWTEPIPLYGFTGLTEPLQVLQNQLLLCSGVETRLMPILLVHRQVKYAVLGGAGLGIFPVECMTPEMVSLLPEESYLEVPIFLHTKAPKKRTFKQPRRPEI